MVLCGCLGEGGSSSGRADWTVLLLGVLGSLRGVCVVINSRTGPDERVLNGVVWDLHIAAAGTQQQRLLAISRHSYCWSKEAEEGAVGAWRQAGGAMAAGQGSVAGTVFQVVCSHLSTLAQSNLAHCSCKHPVCVLCFPGRGTGC
jgi:hypothetical protein